MKSRLPKSECVSPNHTRKISEVLLEFADEIVPPDGETLPIETAVTLAVTLWNLPLLPDVAQKEAMLLLRRSLTHSQVPMVEVEVFRLLDLRRTRYANDRRFVMEYKLHHDKAGPRLVAVSADLDRPENRDRSKPPSD